MGTRLQTTSIAIVEFAFDSHGTRKFDPAHPGVREGCIYKSCHEFHAKARSREEDTTGSDLGG